MTSRCIVVVPEYEQSRALLDETPETEQVVRALESLAARHPFAAPVKPGTLVRVVKTRPWGVYPALRLFYSVRADAVDFLWIERYDAMEA